MNPHSSCFQVPQLTSLVVMGPSESHPYFTVSLNGVKIDHEEAKKANACVQPFVRSPLFTQRIFFSATGITMLNIANASADAVQQRSEFHPWGAIGVEAGTVIADLAAYREKICLRRKTTKVTPEYWFGADSVASSLVGEAAPRTTVRNSDLVEVGDLQYVDEHHKRDLPSCKRYMPSSGKGKKRRDSIGRVISKTKSSVTSPSAARPSFEAALKKSFEVLGTGKSGRNRRNATMFEGDKINKFNCIYADQL